MRPRARFAPVISSSSRCPPVSTGAVALVSALVAAFLGASACGGDGGGSTTGPDGTGDLLVTVGREVTAAGKSVPMEGVAVRASSDAAASAETATTGFDGTASFDGLEPGTYSVEVTPPGPDTLAGSQASPKTATVPAGGSDQVSFPMVYTVSDVDGNRYRTTRIGEHRWTTENLNVAHYRNGDPIPRRQSADAWKQARQSDTGAWAFFENDPSNAHLYARLYNQYAVADPRGLCPEGWHAPTEAEWQTLESHLGMSEASIDSTLWRGRQGKELKSQRTAPDPHPRWADPNEGATNSTGFSAMPSGFRVGDPLVQSQTEGEFLDLGTEGPFWTSTNGDNPDYPEGFWARSLVHRETGIYRTVPDGFGLGVRCVMS